MKTEHDCQLKATPNRTPAKRKNLSGVPVPTRLADEEECRREKVCKVIAELKMVLISDRDSIRHQMVSVLARGLEAFAGNDHDVSQATLIEHRIERGNRLPFRKRARPVPYAFRILIERELNRLLLLGIISEANH